MALLQMVSNKQRNGAFMKSILITSFVSCSIFVLMTGCNVKGPELQIDEAGESPVVQTKTAPETPANVPAESAENEVAGTTYQGSTIREKPADEADGSLQKADVGSGAKGRYEPTGGPTDFVTQPIASLFSAKEMIAFRIQIPDAMRLYKAMHDDQNPPDLETYKKEILEKSQVQLPTLREGEEYVYDPEKGELFVKKPIKR